MRRLSLKSTDFGVDPKSSASERVLKVADIYFPSLLRQRAKNCFDLRLIFWILTEFKGVSIMKKVLQSVATFQVKNADFWRKSRKNRKIRAIKSVMTYKPQSLYFSGNPLH